MSVEVVDESGFTDPAGAGGPGVSVDEVSELARFVLSEMHVHPAADLSVAPMPTLEAPK